MCTVCIEWEAGKLTSKEALKNLGELLNTDGDFGNEHYWKAIDTILEKEIPVVESDDELDKSWHDETHGD